MLRLEPVWSFTSVWVSSWNLGFLPPSKKLLLVVSIPLNLTSWTPLVSHHVSLLRALAVPCERASAACTRRQRARPESVWSLSETNWAQMSLMGLSGDSAELYKYAGPDSTRRLLKSLNPILTVAHWKLFKISFNSVTFLSSDSSF